jgi:hypothetical protein
MENRKLKKKKPKNFQVYMQCSFSLNNLDVCLNLHSWSWCLRCCSVVVSSKGVHKVEQNCTKKPHNVSQVQMQYSFSKFFSMQV